MPITETAFFKYLRTLDESTRTEHLTDCLRAGGELYWELAEHFNEYHPDKLSKLVGES